MKIVRRTLEAKKHPPGSVVRAELNKDWRTSEYYPSHRYGVIEDDGTRTPYTYRTRGEAQARIDRGAGK